jgi:hypothetical protein
MSEVTTIFDQMSSYYQVGQIDNEVSYYFSIGPHKYTLFARPDGCEVKEGKATDKADCVVVTEPKIFADLVLRGKQPGKLDIMRGKFKVSSLPNLLKLQNLFKF